MQDSQDKEATTDEFQSTREYIKILVVARLFASVQTDPGAHTASYTMGTGSLSQG
jgi:hypothetical protein